LEGKQMIATNKKPEVLVNKKLVNAALRSAMIVKKLLSKTAQVKPQGQTGH
jgi:hypothetical protein